MPKRKSSLKSFIRTKAAKTRFTEGQLKQVARRAAGAYFSKGSRRVSLAAWQRGRINIFVTGRGGARKADADIYKRTPKRGKKIMLKNQSPKKVSFYGQR
ncbi:MAG: hypothetical protein CM15mV145_310 [uncultured marine virus]|nr:MAG: hypothetical protein CM15mV145_310 [uncultured marine virus]